MSASSLLRSRWAPAALALCLGWPLVAVAQTPCRTIRFKPGTSSAQIRGVAPADGVACLRFGAGQGQSVKVSVQSPRSQVAFSLEGLVDNRTEYAFISQKRNYDLLVHQTERAATSLAYLLTLSIK